MTKTAARRRPLGNHANSVSPCPPADRLRAREDRRRRRRRERHVLRGSLRDLTNLERIRQCGHVTVGSPGGGPGLRLTTGPAGGAVAGLSGLVTCGSVWSCPVCAAKIATRRADELADVMRFALQQQCKASLVTLTMRHHAGQRLKDCWDALGKAWRAVISGKQWVTDSAAFGLRGWVKAVEVTRGKSGWHVHIHALMIWDKAVTLQVAQHVGDRMWRRWDAALRRPCKACKERGLGASCGRCGFDSLRDAGGLDVRMATLVPGGFGLHEYFVKLSHEITGGQAKLAKGGGRTPFQIAANATETGEAADVHAWWEWEKASHGRRQIGWSTGLREWAGMDDEQTDEQVADEQLEGDDLLFLDLDSWRALRGEPGRVCDLLEVTEDDGYRAAMATLRRWGLGYMLVNRHRGGIP